MLGKDICKKLVNNWNLKLLSIARGGRYFFLTQIYKYPMTVPTPKVHHSNGRLTGLKIIRPLQTDSGTRKFPCWAPLTLSLSFHRFVVMRLTEVWQSYNQITIIYGDCITIAYEMRKSPSNRTGKGTEYSLGKLSLLSYLSGTPVDGCTTLELSTRGISNLWPDLCETSTAPNDKYRFIKQPY